MSKDKTEKKQKTIVDMAKRHLRKHFKRNTPIAYKFHQYTYFKEVVKVAKKIAIGSDASPEEIEILLLANWFRFGGATKQYEDYHTISADMAKAFLTANKYPEAKIQKVVQLILGTANTEKPIGKLAEITYDASVAYMGRKGFSRDSNSLRVELEEVYDKKIKTKDWAQQEYKKLVGVHFYTDYANNKYQDRLADNIQNQRKVIEKAKTALIRKKTGKEFGRGIDTLYRTSYRNHINLSSIADGKANMMISINTIILSAIVTLMATGMSFSNTVSFAHFRYMIPIIILLISVLASAIFAVLSARPKVTNSSISNDDILSRKKSVLFFGNFITMPKKEFIDSLDMLKRNQALLYDNMAVDMYNLGHVLDKKYRLIKHSYNIFMMGLILCVVSFIFLLIYSHIRGVS